MAFLVAVEVPLRKALVVTGRENRISGCENGLKRSNFNYFDHWSVRPKECAGTISSQDEEVGLRTLYPRFLASQGDDPLEKNIWNSISWNEYPFLGLCHLPEQAKKDFKEGRNLLLFSFDTCLLLQQLERYGFGHGSIRKILSSLCDSLLKLNKVVGLLAFERTGCLRREDRRKTHPDGCETAEDVGAFFPRIEEKEISNFDLAQAMPLGLLLKGRFPSNPLAIPRWWTKQSFGPR